MSVGVRSRTLFVPPCSRIANWRENFRLLIQARLRRGTEPEWDVLIAALSRGHILGTRTVDAQVTVCGKQGRGKPLFPTGAAF